MGFRRWWCCCAKREEGAARLLEKPPVAVVAGVGRPWMRSGRVGVKVCGNHQKKGKVAAVAEIWRLGWCLGFRSRFRLTIGLYIGVLGYWVCG